MSEKIFPKRNADPDLNTLLSLFDDRKMSAFITGHLIVESILVQMQEFKGEEKILILKKNFPNKVKSCTELGYFDEKLGNFLNLINDIRNNYAHNLGYDLTADEIFLLAEQAGAAGIDFSDETIFVNKERSFEWYGVVGILQEVFQNTAMDLSFILESHGGEFKFY